jgi:hypothetical protein
MELRNTSDLVVRTRGELRRKFSKHSTNSPQSGLSTATVEGKSHASNETDAHKCLSGSGNSRLGTGKGISKRATHQHGHHANHPAGTPPAGDEAMPKQAPVAEPIKRLSHADRGKRRQAIAEMAKKAGLGTAARKFNVSTSLVRDACKEFNVTPAVVIGGKVYTPAATN